MITARTRLYGVVGHPVDHSLSPVMQGAAFRLAGLDAAYVALPVAPAELGRRCPAPTPWASAGST